MKDNHSARNMLTKSFILTPPLEYEMTLWMVVVDGHE